MPAWLSPFPLASEHEAALTQAGWQRWNGTLQNLPSDGLLLYDAPDRLLALGTNALQAGYEQLQDAELAPRAVALWRLLDPPGNFPEPEPLAGALTLALLSTSPCLLDAYLDLELMADLRGGEPDVAYKRRLQTTLGPAAVIGAWQALQDPREAIEAREEAELTLMQLHQVQEELQQVFLADREKATTIEELTKQLEQQRETPHAELQEAREEAELTLLQLHQVQDELEQVFLADREKATTIEELMKQLEQQRQTPHAELQEAREEAELTLLQLHQVQEELEHYFLLSRGQHQQLERYSQLQQRSQRLLAQLAQPSMASST